MLNKLAFILAAVNAMFAQVEAKQDSCYALALSGGGTNAVWEAGVVWGLTHYGNPEDFKWDVITGISGGSINTGLLSVWAVGDELKASEFMS